MLETGTRLGNYLVEGEVGGGGMARVYRVRHAVLGKLHALKVLEASYRDRADVRDRFLAEGRIAAQLVHPNIVQVTDTISTPEVAGLVMVLVEGPTLEGYIGEQRMLPSADQVRELFLPILDAVGYAHRHGIIHRDLKPANVLLERIESGYRPKVTDFGIAKVTEAAGDLARKKASTNADARMGTLAYMSPEQIRAAKHVTARSDIFSLGATLYELATCMVAFHGDSDYEVMKKIVEGHYTRVMPDIDPGIAAAINRALEVDPDRRFANCEEFAEALKALPRKSVQRTTPVAAPPMHAAPPKYNPQKTQRNRASPVASPPTHAVRTSQDRLPAPVETDLEVVPVLHGFQDSQPSPFVATPRDRNGPRKAIIVSGAVVLAAAVIGVVARGAYYRSPADPTEGPGMTSTQTAPPVSVRQGWVGPKPFDGCSPRKGRPATLVVAVYMQPLKLGEIVEQQPIRDWFKKVPPSSVEVLLLTKKDGSKRVAWVLPRDRWPRWKELTGDDTTDEVCWLIGRELKDQQIGRPGALDFDVTDETAMEHAFPQRRSLGDLDSALSPAGKLPELKEWLEQPAVAPPQAPPAVDGADTDTDTEEVDDPYAVLVEPTLPEQPSRGDVVAGMAAVVPQVRHCYEVFGAPGTILASFVVGRDGLPGSVDIEGTANWTRGGRECVADAVGAARFPRFRGQPITIRYPFILQ